MAAIANLYADQGSTFSTNIQVDGMDQFLMDLTGYTFRGKVARHPWAKEKYDFTISAQPEDGSLTIEMSAQTTALLRHPRYMYDVEIVSPDGIVTRILEGQLFVSPEVTK